MGKQLGKEFLLGRGQLLQHPAAALQDLFPDRDGVIREVREETPEKPENFLPFSPGSRSKRAA